MTAKKYLIIGLLSQATAGLVANFRFGTNSHEMVRSDTPWVVLCFVLGIAGSVLIGLSLVKIIRFKIPSLQKTKAESFTMVWVMWLLLAIAQAFRFVPDYNKPAIDGIDGFVRPTVSLVVLFFVLFFVVAAVRSRKVGWIRALSLYSLDKHVDEREREIQYQATGITFTVLLGVLISVGMVLSVHPPTYQGAYITLFTGIICATLALRGFITWFLGRR